MAADEASDFAFLTAAARRSSQDLRRVLERTPRHAGERGSHYLAVIEATLNALDTAIATRESEFAAATDPADKRAIVVATRQINIYILSLHGITPDIESVAETPLDLGFVYFVDQLVTELLQQKADIVMLPGLRYNYTTGFRPFEELLSDLGVTTYPVSVPPIEVRFPMQEADSLFLHLVIAHELAHHVIDQEKVDEKILSGDPDAAANGASVASAISDFETIHSATTVRARAEVLRRLRSWLDELICDSIALGVIGPSYLLTFASFIMPLAGSEPGKSHPPAMLRLKFLLGLVHAWDWLPTLDAHIPTTLSWMSEIAARPQEAGVETYYLRIEEILNRFEPVLRSEVEKVLGAKRYTRQLYEEQSKELATLLENHVLPAQLADTLPTDQKAVILAGWLSAFTQRADEPTALVEIIADREYQRFLGKALEMSTVLNVWATL